MYENDLRLKESSNITMFPIDLHNIICDKSLYLILNILNIMHHQ